MAETSIEWCDFTFNHIRGCTKVSPGCKFCYAETLSKRNPAALGNWGPQGVRVVAAEKYWRDPIKWNANARTAGRRARVFCASLADVFEAADTMPAESWPVVQAACLRLLRLIFDTPHLDWLLLTKRPENIMPALMQAFQLASSSLNSQAVSDEYYEFMLWLSGWSAGTPPKNVWLGTSVENQQQADIRVPQLLAAPAAVRFLSCEPLLGPVDLTKWMPPGRVRARCARCGYYTHKEPGCKGYCEGKLCDGLVCPGCGSKHCWSGSHYGNGKPNNQPLSWVIVGGESGPKARPMHINWASNLRNQCEAAGVPFLFKQWGEHRCFTPVEGKPDGISAKGRTDWHNWPGGCVSVKLGKHDAGRLLDGQEYNQFPSPVAQ